MLPSAAWVSGDGPYALVAWCRVPTVTLWTTRDKAKRVLADLDACGQRCHQHHEILRLVLADDSFEPTQREAP
jgi:hypothetical protein